jgi:hypothetical protein
MEQCDVRLVGSVVLSAHRTQRVHAAERKQIAKSGWEVVIERKREGERKFSVDINMGSEGEGEASEKQMADKSRCKQADGQEEESCSEEVNIEPIKLVEQEATPSEWTLLLPTTSSFLLPASNLSYLPSPPTCTLSIQAVAQHRH